MTTNHDFGARLRSWFFPTSSFACAIVLAFACSTEERRFGNGNGNDMDASSSGGSSGTSGSVGSGGEDIGGGGTSGSGGTVSPDSGAPDSGDPDSGNPDSGEPDSGEPEAGVPQECLGKTNGTPCGDMSGSICVNEACGQSLCGDSYIDVAIDEECEDGNAVAGDGCDPEECKYSCDDNTDCDDQYPCNGVESCDSVSHKCVAGTAPDSTEQVPCERELAASAGDAGVPDAGDGGMPLAGICKSGFCVVAGCGNGLVQAGEECDDSNTVSTDGCKIDCTYTCEGNDECDDQDVCTGSETCNVGSHTCVAGTPLVCDDGNDCTADSCDPVLGCQVALIDADGDGHADEALGACGDDCDDDDDTIYTGAGELCDGKDNDCDNSEDENAPIWYLDCDGDGYAANGAFAVQNCNIPDPQVGCQGAGWTSRIPRDQPSIDCFDANATVRPMPVPDSFSATGVTGKTTLPFDWNCDNVEEKEAINTGVATGAYCGPPIIIGLGAAPIAAACTGILCPILSCTGAAGYSAATLPACGVSATYSSCSNASGTCKRVVATRAERCR